MASSNPSPSAARRKALRESDIVTIRINNKVSVTNYLQTATALYSAFVDAVTNRNLDAAYLYGIRYATLVIEKLPKHRHFRTTERQKAQVESVLQSLEQLTQRMDAEELVKERQRKEQEEEAKRLEIEKRKQEQEARQDTIGKSAMAKLKKLQSARDLTGRTKNEAPASMDIRMTKSSDATAAERRITHPDVAAVPQPSTASGNNDSVPTVPEATPVSGRTTSATSTTDEPHVSLRSSETAVIELLNEMIRRHCERLPRLQQQMRQLKVTAVAQYKAGNTKSALQRIAHRRKVRKQYTITERAVFGMETQIMMIQAAASDRDAAAALKEAESALAELHQKQAVEETHEKVAEDLEEIHQVSEALSEDWSSADEEDLLRELQEDSAIEESSSQADESLLALPEAPSPTEAEESSSFFWKKKKKSVSPTAEEPTVAATFM